MAHAHTVQDLAFDQETDTLETAIAGLEADFPIKVEVLQLEGPGGGWPEVKLTGDRAVLERLLVERWSWSPHEVAALVEG